MIYLIFIFGLIIGSFLNVVIYRYNTGRGIGGRSGCFSCGKTLAWYELFPVLSFLLQKGRCTKCYTKLSWQYPLVELITGLMFALIYSMFGFTLAGLIYLLIGIYSIMISVYDIRHTIIPDSWVYTLSVFGIILNYQNIVNVLIAGLIIFSFFALLWLMGRGNWMGFGDAKLGLAMGLVLGISKGVTAVMVGFWLGAIVGILLMILTKIFSKFNYHLKSEIPFGPFLILGMWLSIVFNLDLVWMAGLFAF